MEELHHISGVFDYCLDLVPTGKVFNLIFYEYKRRFFTKGAHYIFKIDQDMHESLKWWALSLGSRPVRWLLEEYWWSSMDADEVIYTDASTKTGLGIYRQSRGEAYAHVYDRLSTVYKVLNGPREGALVHVNTMELLAVLSAVQIASDEIHTTTKQRKKVLVLCDNASACEAVARMKVKDYVMIQLLKDLTEEMKKIDLRVCHISGEFNPADWLTRSDKIHEFPTRFNVRNISNFSPPSIDEYYLRAKLMNENRC
jgi:hypothetical protein